MHVKKISKALFNPHACLHARGSGVLSLRVFPLFLAKFAELSKTKCGYVGK